VARFFPSPELSRDQGPGASAAEAAAIRKAEHTRTGLTDQQAAQVSKAAAASLASVASLNSQAAQIVAAQLAKFPGGKLPSASAVPAPLPQLAALQKQRDDMTTSQVAELQTLLGATAFARLDYYVRTTFKPKPAPPGTAHPNIPAPPRKGAVQ
jgi:hypothetical protein